MVQHFCITNVQTCQSFPCTFRESVVLGLRLPPLHVSVPIGNGCQHAAAIHRALGTENTKNTKSYLGIGEDGLASLVDGGEVHEHGGVAVASPGLVDLVMEVVEVRLVLLAVLVPEYLNVLSVL
jgi:hypothetical protein